VQLLIVGNSLQPSDQKQFDTLYVVRGLAKGVVGIGKVWFCWRGCRAWRVDRNADLYGSHGRFRRGGASDKGEAGD